jgi:integrase
MNGSGSVRLCADRRLWEARISLRSSTGKRIQKSKYFRSRSDAISGLDAMRQRYGIVHSPEVTLRDHLRTWLERNQRDWAVSTYRLHQRYADSVLIPSMGMKRLASIEVTEIDKLAVTLAQEGRGATTINAVLRTLKTALNDAVRQSLIKDNPAARARKPKIRVGEKHVLDLSEARRLLRTATNNKYYALYAVAIMGGLREGEIFALTWEDVNFDRRSVFVNATLTEDASGNLVRTTPKTPKSRREVLLPEIAIDALRAHPRGSGTFVFTDSEGKPIRKSNFLRRHFHVLLKAAHLPKVTFHSLRHTANSLLIADGVSILVAQQRGGWASTRMPLDRYAHLQPSTQAEAANRLDRMFGNVESHDGNQ